ncbi:L,D-transpeptidase family protein, partial [Mediterraneibacter glycyrrhizinilyticus]|uniref:L,D-transpeptidase family protein n=1 Tax=Mediterraneibacter glycyrrhizinilyticus TaxID=342942 RepID=UPI0025A4295E
AGWYEENGSWYYIMPDGTYRVGWLSFGDTYYYCGSNGAIVYGKQSIGGKWYYFDADGVRQSSAWYEDEDGRYYMMPDGSFRTGWLSFGDTYYYCGSNGAIVYGKQNIGGKWYYFDADGVRQSNAWYEDGDGRYYMMSDGSFRVGWLSFGDTYYYCGSNGAIVYGKQKIGSNWYYFNNNGVRQKNTWITNGDEKYYALSDGTLRVGWLSFGDTYYYCGSDASIIRGIQYPVNGVLYTFDGQGVMKKEGGWGSYNGHRYYKNPSTGFPYTGWISFGSTYYYANSNGWLVSGWQNIGGKYYYFYSDTYTMARNTVIDGYTIGADGTRVATGLAKMTEKAWGYSSSTSYLLMVDRDSHKVGVFRGSQGNWTNLYYWDCTNGAPSTPTVSGVFTVGIKGYYFDSGASRCFWYTQFYGNYLFHTVLCYKDGSIMDGRLGMALSHGCVRLSIANAKWIYDNIPSGTTVVVY